MNEGASDSAEAVLITTLRDALEVLRSDRIHKLQVPSTAPFNEGTLGSLDGSAHLSQRRAFNRLVRRDAHERYQESILIPTIARHLADTLASVGPDGVARTDLIPFVRGIFFELAAALSGIQIEGPEDREALTHLMETISQGFNRIRSPRHNAQADDSVAAAHSAIRELHDRFYKPSFEGRVQLIRRLEAGEVSEEQMPIDAMSLVVSKAHPSLEDEGTAFRQVKSFLNGASNTNLLPIGHSIDELEVWFNGHPEDNSLRTDSTFLAAAVNEILRLHTAFPEVYRLAIGDFDLASGLQIKAGQTIAVNISEASRDESVYGSDADTFNPHRQVPQGVYPWGLAFSSGPHMCPGLPIVIGAQGIDGTHVHLLQALYGAGVRRDHSLPTRKREWMPGVRDVYLSYPVLFQPS